METFEERIRRVVQEDVAVVPYNPCWPELFRQEKEHLLSCLPAGLIRSLHARQDRIHYSVTGEAKRFYAEH